MGIDYTAMGSAMRLPLLYFSTLAYTTLVVAWICYAGYCR